jgi:putative hydrolase of the HAD superfamily
MSEVKVLLFDVGGVVLTNGWDRGSRRLACETFGLDWEDFEDRHEFVSPEFETGKLTMSGYLERTVFYRHRDFTEAEFIDFMKARSAPMPESLALLEELAGSSEYLLATLNNESLELNAYRIETFGLRDYFSMFLSSCFLGVKKPDERIYRLALDITQHRPEQCIFIDDRALNLECADRLGIRTIHFTNTTQLRASLDELGITASPITV